MSIAPIKKKFPLQYIDIRVRLMSLLLCLPLGVFLCSTRNLVVFTLLTVLIIFLSGVSFKTFWYNGRFYFILSTVGFLLMLTIFSPGSIFQRLLDAAVLALRFNIVISLGMIYALTTNPNEIPQALLRMHIPHRFGTLIMVGLRLYPLIVKRMQSIIQIATARGLNLNFSMKSPSQFLNSINIIMPTLLLSTLEVGARLGETMLARGYDPDHPITVSPEIHMKALDYTLIIGVIGLLLVTLELEAIWK